MRTVMKKDENQNEIKIETGEDVMEETAIEIAQVKQLIRWISKSNITNPAYGYDSVANIDEELSAYLQIGYKLVSTHYLGENVEGFGVLYVLVHN